MSDPSLARSSPGGDPPEPELEPVDPGAVVALEADVEAGAAEPDDPQAVKTTAAKLSRPTRDASRRDRRAG